MTIRLKECQMCHRDFATVELPLTGSLVGALLEMLLGTGSSPMRLDGA